MWKYIAVKENGVFGIKEDFGEYGISEGFISPRGDTLDELIGDLKLMLKDIQDGETKI